MKTKMNDNRADEMTTMMIKTRTMIMAMIMTTGSERLKEVIGESA